MRSPGALSRAVYVDELGRRHVVEFWAGRIVVCDPLGAPRVVLPAPFSAEHAAALRFWRWADCLVIAHPELRPRLLYPLSDLEWRLEVMRLEGGALDRLGARPAGS